MVKLLMIEVLRSSVDEIVSYGGKLWNLSR